MLRGCRLRNSAWVVGVVLYCGRETTLYQSSSTAGLFKRSYVRWCANLFILAFVVLEVITCAFLAYRFINLNEDIAHLQLDIPRHPLMNPRSAAVRKFFSWILICTHMVPISIQFYLTVAMGFQSLWLTRDRSFGGGGCMVKVTESCADLGKVRFIFSDKTGTVTTNYMRLAALAIEDATYGDLSDKMSGIKTSTPHVNIADSRLVREISQANRKVVDFFIHLAINHESEPEALDEESGVANLVCEVPSSSEELPSLPTMPSSSEDLLAGEPVYSSTSADEEALVYTAYHFGFRLLKVTTATVVITVPALEAAESAEMRESSFAPSSPADGGPALPAKSRLEAVIERRIPFSSVRKRSSVLCHFTDPIDGRQRRVLFCKGADSTVLPLAESGTSTNMRMYLQRFSSRGLRTLVFGYRELDSGDDKSMEYQEMSVEDLEKDLVIQGCSGIDDCIAEGVHTTISRLTNAGITTWMLTGDKVETAVNIAERVGLIPPVVDHSVVVLDDLKSAEDIVSSLPRRPPPLPHARPAKTGRMKRLRAALRSSVLYWVDGSSSTEKRENRFERTIVVDGGVLDVLLNSAAFISACVLSQSVVVARCSPLQKAKIVAAVKKRLSRFSGEMTLAIGDGGNDCPMLQTADIGVGIRGMEGSQAVSVSSFGVEQFKDLVQLLLVHGRWNDQRCSRLVLLSLYKMIVINMPNIFFAPYHWYSGTRFYYEIHNQFFNYMYTSLPSMFLATLDQDVQGEVALRKPELYKENCRQSLPRRFVSMVIEGLVHAYISFYVPFHALLATSLPWANGRTGDIWATGMLIFICALCTLTVRIWIDSHTAFLWSSLGSLLGVGICFGVTALVPELRETFHMLTSTPLTPMAIFITVTLSMTVPIMWKVIRRIRWPRARHRAVKGEPEEPPTALASKRECRAFLFQQPEPQSPRQLRSW